MLTTRMDVTATPKKNIGWMRWRRVDLHKSGSIVVRTCKRAAVNYPRLVTCSMP